MSDCNKNTAIQNEQQLITKQKIINEIIGILSENELSIIDAKEILYQTSKVICKQRVKACV